MKIKVEKWKFNNNESYKILEFQECCNRIINSNNITINAKYSYDGISDYDDYDCYEYSVKLVEFCTDHEGYEDYIYEKINFCPFCGKQIEIEIVNEIDKTEEYNKFSRERDELNIKRRKTDSKKEERELSERIKIIDMTIDEFYRSDCFKGILED